MAFFQPKEIKIFLIVLASSVGLTILATSLYLIFSAPPPPPSGPAVSNPFLKSVPMAFDESPLLSDFMIPGEGGNLVKRGWRFYREPLKKWSEEEVKKFWVDPATFSIKDLPQKNDLLIESLFEGTP